MDSKRFYQHYRDYILLNKNILVSGVFAFFGGALFTQLYAQYDNNNLSNSIVTLSVEYAIYIPLFALLFYMDNRNRYVDPLTGRKDKKRIKSDIKKLIAAFSLSELIFSFSKIAIHYELLQTSMAEPYQASMIGSLTAWAIFLVSINLSVKAVKLFRR
ncbi:MAG: hypothetical protein WAM88_07860 [Nitrososphaeraceae archaeon]